MGYFDLSRYPALECEKKYAILSIVCQGRKQIFLDSDRDGDFRDEEALGIYEFDRCVYDEDTRRMTASVTTVFYRKGA